MQQGMLFHCLAAPRSGIDVAQVIGTLDEQLDVRAFLAAWQRLTDRHEALRLRFCWDGDGYPRQFPLPAATLPIDEQDWSKLSAPEQERRLEGFLAEDRLRGFDPRMELPTRVTLFFLGEGRYRFVWTWWHGVLDGRSNLILLEELFHFYDAFRRGDDADLPLPRRYAEYIEWLASRNPDGAATYWKEALAGFTDPTPVSAGHALTASGTGMREVRLPEPVTSQLRTMAKAQGVTLNTVLQAAWALTLSRYSGRDDVVFGATRACRHAALGGNGSGNGIVGALINTVPVRARLQPETRLGDFLRILRNDQVAVRPYEQTPLVEIQSYSGVPANQRLFESIVVYENRLLNSILCERGGTWRSRRFEMRGQTGYPLTVYAYGEPELLLGIVNERTSVDDDSAARILAHLTMVLRFLAERPDSRLGDVPACPDQERRLLLEDWNNTSSPFPADHSIQQCFEQQAARTPEAPAVTCQGETWTYRQLDQRAGQIARHLLRQGAAPEKLIAICMERSLDLLAGMLAILKTGATYLPLDPDYPPDRLRLMLDDARPLLVIASRKSINRLPAVEIPVLTIDDRLQNSRDAVSVSQQTNGRSLAYVIYTSGSTGMPKGVMVEHRNVMNFFTGMDAVLGTQPGVWLAVASVSFDASVLELWWPLTRGYHVVLWPGMKAASGPTIPELLLTWRVTHLACVPSFLRMLLTLPGAAETLAELQMLILGGEPVLPSLLRDLGPSASRRIVEQYGPTETTVASTAWEILPEATTAIGRPIANTRVYVLDSQRRPVPLGAVGELYIGGAGVARGYLNRPELTAEKFLPNPFGSGRLYRSGDLVRYRPDGVLEYIGRVDDQVKIRGHRVEPGEIAMILASHPQVSEAVVDVQPGPDGEGRLVAWLVPTPGGSPTARQMREWLGGKLPGYMIPSAFLMLDAIPRSPNGKLDRAALHRAGQRQPQLAREYVAATPLEAELAKLWCQALKLEQVDPQESFFDLGGDSLAAMRLMVAIQQHFGVDLPLQTIFQAPSVCLLSEHLAELARGSSAADTSSGRRAPRTATERRLIAIWENLLAIHPIGVRDSFFALHPHPALFDRMLAEVRTAFGVFAEGLPVGKLLDNPTIETLARVIDESIRPPASLVVCLQAQGTARPLFLIHAGGGYVFFYHALASRLGPNRPVYGIRAETHADHLGRPYPRTRSVEELAARYIAEIRTIQPHGPYLLGGACFGGVVAFEMARQLRAQGESVGPVLLFDSYIHNNPYRRQDAVSPFESETAPLRRRLHSHLDRVARLGLRGGIAYGLSKLWHSGPGEVRSQIGALRRGLRSGAARLADQTAWAASCLRGTPAPLELIQRRMMGGFLEVTRRLLLGYTPEVGEGRLVLFVAAEGDDPEPLWQGLAQDGLIVHRLPGVHLEMMEEPVVVQVAALIERYLEQEDLPGCSRSARISSLVQ
jgi:amino acid adenylation domain-containing protein